MRFCELHSESRILLEKLPFELDLLLRQHITFLINKRQVGGQKRGGAGIEPVEAVKSAVIVARRGEVLWNILKLRKPRVLVN